MADSTPNAAGTAPPPQAAPEAVPAQDPTNPPLSKRGASLQSIVHRSHSIQAVPGNAAKAALRKARV